MSPYHKELRITLVPHLIAEVEFCPRSKVPAPPFRNLAARPIWPFARHVGNWAPDGSRNLVKVLPDSCSAREVDRTGMFRLYSIECRFVRHVAPTFPYRSNGSVFSSEGDHTPFRQSTRKTVLVLTAWLVCSLCK